MKTTLYAALAIALSATAIAWAEPPAGKGDLAALYDALRAPQVIATAPAPDVLTVGRARLQPAPGSRLLVIGVGGDPCGWVLDGAAALEYRVEDPVSVPVARHNLKQARGLSVAEADGSLVLTAELQGVAVWGWEIDLGEAVQVESFGLPPWLSSLLQAKITDNPERDMLLARRNGQPEYRWAVFHGSDDLYLDVDPRPTARSESLARFERVPSGPSPYSGRLTSEELATQPIGRSWLEGNPLDVVAVDTEIALRAEAKDQLRVTTHSRLQVLRDGMRVLPLSLWDEIHDEKWRPREYRVDRVTIDGKPAPYLHREDVLYVELAQPARRGATVELEVEAAGEVLVRPSGDNYWRLITGWYPRPALGGDEMAELRLTMDVPEPFVPFAPGEVLERVSEDGRNRVTTRLQGPMERAAVLAGRYGTVTEEHEGARVHVSTYASSKDKEARQLAGIVLAVRGCMERWFGVPYPFADLQVIEVNEWGWGQAPPGMIFITQEAFLNRATARATTGTELLASITTRGINERIAHEVAHAWFPHVAKVTSTEESWLSESLADYTSAYCLAETMGGKQARYHWKRQVDQWKYWSKLAGDDTSVFLAEHLSASEQDQNNRYYLLYGRGPLVLQGVRERLEEQHGEDKGRAMFLTWIRSYVKTFELKPAETRHLIGILEQISGQSWQEYFERHLLGTEQPPVK